MRFRIKCPTIIMQQLAPLTVNGTETRVRPVNVDFDFGFYSGDPLECPSPCRWRHRSFLIQYNAIFTYYYYNTTDHSRSFSTIDRRGWWRGRRRVISEKIVLHVFSKSHSIKSCHGEDEIYGASFDSLSLNFTSGAKSSAHRPPLSPTLGPVLSLRSRSLLPHPGCSFSAPSAEQTKSFLLD